MNAVIRISMSLGLFLCLSGPAAGSNAANDRARLLVDVRGECFQEYVVAKSPQDSQTTNWLLATLTFIYQAWPGQNFKVFTHPRSLLGPKDVQSLSDARMYPMAFLGPPEDAPSVDAKKMSEFLAKKDFTAWAGEKLSYNLRRLAAKGSQADDSVERASIAILQRDFGIQFVEFPVDCQ